MQAEVNVSPLIPYKSPNFQDAYFANKLSLFSSTKPKTTTALMQNVSNLKQNCSLFAQLYISSQAREENLDESFSHENQNFARS